MLRYPILCLLFALFLNSSSEAQTLKVMSYNIHHGYNKDEIDKLEEMGSFIKSSGADLVGLQEVDSLCNRSGKKDQMKRLAEITGMYYAFVRHFAYDGGAYGLGILSRYPIAEIRNDRITSLGKQGSLALLSAEVSLPGNSKVLFSTVHFALDQPTRLKQAEESIRFLKRDFPVILTGDLNAEPGTPEIVKLSDYFRGTGAYEQLSFPEHKPVKRIDYIFISSTSLKKVLDTKVPGDIYHSDHLPLISRVKLKRVKQKGSSSLKVMSYNIHHANPPSRPDFIDLDAIARVISDQQPDLVAVQEVDVKTVRSGASVNEAELLGAKTGMRYYFAKAIDYDGGDYGIAILSKYKLSSVHTYPLPTAEGSGGEPRVLATAIVKVPGKGKMLFAATHLDAQKSPVNRKLQIAAIAQILEKEKRPVIIGGDFNAEQGTEVIDVLDKYFTRTCTGDCPYTIPVLQPVKTIDFIAFKPAGGFNVTEHKVINETYASDHLPVVVRFSLR